MKKEYMIPATEVAKFRKIAFFVKKNCINGKNVLFLHDISNAHACASG